ncbi:hypothetical protein [Rhodopirellula bahusiensis]|uniref:hypothetical protein n=1 Tax=Rhodopirellula bahusiensis TaxID=2014065 RepID=UPI003264BDD2
MTNNPTTQSKRPSLYAYQVRETGNGSTFWNRIGACWENKAGGFTIQLDCVPLDGRIVCQPPKAEDKQT